MLMIVPLGIAVVCFVIGSLLVYKGYQAQEQVQGESSSVDEDIVPINDPEEIDELKNQYAVVSDEPADPPEHEDKDPRPTLSIEPTQEAPPDPAEQAATAADEIAAVLAEDSSSDQEIPEETNDLTATPSTSGVNDSNDELMSQIDQLKYQLRDIEENSRLQAIQAMEDRKLLEDKLKEAEERVEAASARVSVDAEGSAKLFAVEEELRNLKTSHEELQTRLAEKEEQLRHQVKTESSPEALEEDQKENERLSQLEAEVAKLQQDVQEKDAKILEHQQEIIAREVADQSQEDITELRDEIDRLKNDNERIVEELQGKENQLLEAQQQLVASEAAPSNTEELEQKLEATDEKMQKLSEENERLGGELTEKTGKLSELERSLEELKGAAAESASPDLQKELDAKVAQLQEQDIALKEAHDGREELERTKQELEEQIRERDQELMTIKSETDIMKTQAEEVQNQQKSQIEKLQQEWEVQKKQIGDDRQSDLAAIEKYKGELHELKEERLASQQRIQSLEEEVNIAKSAIASAQQAGSQNESIQQELDKIRGEYEKGLKQVQDLEQALQTEQQLSASKISELSTELEKFRQEASNKSESQVPSVSPEDLAKLQEALKKQLEKEKLLVYELSKSKAQIMGLEKICEDFKRQLEQGK